MDDALDEDAKIEALERVMRRVPSLPAMKRGALIKRMAKKLGQNEKDVRGTWEACPPASIRLQAHRVPR